MSDIITICKRCGALVQFISASSSSATSWMCPNCGEVKEVVYYAEVRP